MLTGPVTFDAKSFLVGGRRVWLHVGEIHYFRHPVESWEVVLRRARAAGLNTISTYVPWNFHELREGQADFTGDRDLARYLDLVRSLGMYAIFRPGPYICSEWDGGGIPAWVFDKPGIRTRDDDPTYMDCVRRWFDRLLPLAVPRQVSRGGPVILVQNENEYDGGWNESTRSYVRKINAHFRAAGFDVPIVACNCHGRPPSGMVINGTHERADQMIWPDMVLTYNWGPGAECIRRLREAQPDKPLLMTEYWAGPQVLWGRPIGDYCPAAEYGRSMIEFASLGCQITYYMFDGGTNFGYWAGRNIVTSYQSNYPVREGGLLGEKYYRLKPANHCITQFGEELAGSEEVTGSLGATVSAGARLVVRACPAGHLLFVSDDSARPAIRLTLQGGEAVDVAMPSIRALVVPLNFEVLPGVRIESSNLGLLGKGERSVVLWGVAATEGHVRVNGRPETVVVPAGRPAELKFGGARVFVVDENLAGRTWFLDDGRIVFGADFAELAPDGRVRTRHSDATGRVFVADGRSVDRTGRDGHDPHPTDQHALSEVPPVAVPPLPALPALTGWRRLDCPERTGEGDGWTALPDGPRSHEALGRYLGYVWYRAEFEAADDGMAPIFAPMRSTRLTVYANGVYCGTSGELTRFVEFCGYRHPADALAQDQVTVPVKKGLNRIVLLSDHLGRWFNGKPDPQGLRGPVYLGVQQLNLSGASPVAPTAIDEEAFRAMCDREFRRPEPLPGVERVVDVPAETDGYLLLPSGLTRIAVSVEGRHVIGLPKAKYPFTAVRLPEWIAGKRVTLRVQSRAEGEHAPELEHVNLFLASRRNALNRWAWKPGGDGPDAMQAHANVVAPGQAEAWEGLMPDLKQPVGSGAKPAYFTVNFPTPPGELPVFLGIGKMHKGQLFLNGRNLGRFWQVGGFHQGNGVQSRYYLPRPWMRGQNTLAVFEEYGLPPQGVSLQWGAAGGSVDVTRV